MGTIKRKRLLYICRFKKDFTEGLAFDLDIGKSRGYQILKAISSKEESRVTSERYRNIYHVHENVIISQSVEQNHWRLGVEAEKKNQKMREAVVRKSEQF